jgi:hypothetical protein
VARGESIDDISAGDMTVDRTAGDGKESDP